ncbi:Uncharacterised protein [Enterococcus malodoratus]|uniref:Uncharacterized protein n=1 Tax=Enterococcus malodoratus ATCC 43197 TaxID=1158601 RepID=R2R1G8_9ENTE|nr:hypothetical protein UAI_02152 [Enterococcus malodoratus ATCC 43197]EOT64071.1 hypothetical protein I585_03268 [Enterococcus malodoratus ATCC 43197]OJG61223.1 hypothetical protein RV07_GL002070 [Enterococcus malodoratus]SPX00925.1 Uncharacterised protein [Enterococcus malodoratus]STD66127.1 Uncharacterised protein [Enterococcus malodoratus]
MEKGMKIILLINENLSNTRKNFFHVSEMRKSRLICDQRIEGASDGKTV